MIEVKKSCIRGNFHQKIRSKTSNFHQFMVKYWKKISNFEKKIPLQ